MASLKSVLLGNFALILTESFIFILSYSSAVELTFELEDNSRQCFYEQIDRNIKCILEYQVVTGGKFDVDLTLYDPNGQKLYEKQKQQYDSYQFDTKHRGEYKFCFSNEFSTFAHKVVYFDFQVGEEPPIIPEMGDHHTALTQIESSAVAIHEALKVILDYQTHHRLREASGRQFAEDLNIRVQWWSLGQSICILLLGLGQVIILRSFFSDKKSAVRQNNPHYIGT